MKKWLLIGTLLLTAPTASAPDPVLWPEGSGEKLVKANCLICHSGDIIVGQRLSLASWTKTVEKMAGWGAPVKDDDREALIDYLSKNFSPEAPLQPPLRAIYEL